MRNNDANVLFSNEIRSYLYGGLVVSAILGIGIILANRINVCFLNVNRDCAFFEYWKGNRLYCYISDGSFIFA